MLKYKKLEFIGIDDNFKKSVEDLNNKIRDKVKIIQYIMYIIAVIIELMVLYMLMNKGVIAVILVLLLVFLTRVIIKRFERDITLKVRHKMLEDKEIEKYIVYMNLLTVMEGDDYEITLSDNMFKLKGKLGTWRFKEITLPESLEQGVLKLNVNDLTLSVE